MKLANSKKADRLGNPGQGERDSGMIPNSFTPIPELRSASPE
jgi:hypothetical protein